MSDSSQARRGDATTNTTDMGEADSDAAVAGRAESATTPSPVVESPVVQDLQKAATGLLFPSETDAPLTPFVWPDEEPETLTPERVRERAQAPADAPIKSVKLETFFRPATKEEEWHNDEEKAQVRRFQELVKTLRETLKTIQVFRVGETKLDVYIVGQTDGGYAGLHTMVVET